MAASVKQLYLHPLTLESTLFLNSLEVCGKIYNRIDPYLYDSLRNVVLGIEKFLDQNPTVIEPTDDFMFVTPKELAVIPKIYHCTFCKKNLGSTVDKAAIHLAERHPTAKTVNLPKRAKAIVESDFGKFFADQLQVAETLKQIPEYDVIENSLSDILKEVFPDKSIEMYKFGSRITGIGTENSDLDIYVDIGGRFNEFEHAATAETLQIFDRAYYVFKNKTIDWRLNHAARGARIPILKLTNTRTKIKCDVGFSNSISYCNKQMLEYIFQQQPIARRMCIFMKKWLELTGLNRRITTYCMSLMVIYYLQINNFLPSIETLQKNMLANVLVGPWISNFIEIPLTELKMEVLSVSPSSCKQHIKEFFIYYADFDYESHVICPYFGRTHIKIENFESLMPERYTNFVQSKNSAKDFRIELDKHMVVQDPLRMNHNVAERVTKVDLMEWQHFLKKSAVLIIVVRSWRNNDLIYTSKYPACFATHRE
ncbi:terminal uridylyltransferase Tailor-like isoform X1 [Rhagoletis pomonella]|uniref:terminal uridylyltransferase Tailor-like isoform X1 n=1 Tax=Rhagoletis pomonella TaxID=28610 RepID=UPI00177DBB5F|nr:terminal uridylyltransferase Tailor-like isoform X1 [Rhagoletis pomonella]